MLLNFGQKRHRPQERHRPMIHATNEQTSESLLSRSDLTTSPVPSPGTPQVFVSPDGGAFAAISGPPVTKVDKALP